MVRTALIGYGAHGKDIHAIWRHTNGGYLDLFDDNVKGLRPLSAVDGRQEVLVGINDPKKRRLLAGAHKIAVPLIDRSAYVASGNLGAHIGDGSIVAQNACIMHSVLIGIHTHVNYGCSMVRTTIGDFTTISPGVVICGDVHIGDETMIGAGAVICDRVRIGSRCIVGAGAVVLPGTIIQDDDMWLGVPAQRVWA